MPGVRLGGGPILGAPIENAGIVMITVMVDLLIAPCV